MATQPPEAKRWALLGALFQVPMIAIYSVCLSQFPFVWWQGWNPLRYIHMIGAAIFVWCLYILYIRHRALTNLVVDGPFRYTRHPMYSGLLLMDTAFWFNQPVRSSLFYGLQVAFLIELLVAAYCQERETLARFGDAAVVYYKRTPRIPFLI